MLERVFLDSPLSRLGAFVATLVGLAIGFPLSTGRVEVHDGLIVCRGLPKWAFRRGGTCVGRVYLTRDVVGERTFRHERVHVRQWRRYGFLFPVLYWAAGLDPLRNRFEIEAGLEDGGYIKRRRPTPPTPPTTT
nr:Fe-S oxidoreductase [Pseudoclavibacter chungangensis]